MKIGIIGSGNIGSTLARLFVEAGNDVAISNSRGPETLAELVAKLGAHAHAATPQEAATFGDVVIEAIPFGRYMDLPAQQLAGKILITASNYYPQRDGTIELGGQAQSEFLSDYLGGGRVVKAFNTIWYQHLQHQGDSAKPLEQRRVIPISGDDPDAKETVAQLVTSIGFAPLDMGSLHDSTRQEPDSPIYNKDLTLAEAQELLRDDRR